MTLPTTDQALSWIGLPVHDTSGTAIGSCRNVFADDDSGVPEWVEVELAGGDLAFVPTLGAGASGGTVTVAHALDVVEGAPRFTGDVDLSPEAEKALYEHYGVPYSTERSETLLPAAAATSDGATPAPAPEPAAPAATRLRRVEVPAAAPAAVVPPAPAPTGPPPVTSQPPASSSGSREAVLLAAVPVAAAGIAALAARRRRAQQPEVTPEQGGAGLVALLVAIAGLLTWRRNRRSHVAVGPVVRLPGVTDHTGLTGVVPVDPTVVDLAAADPARAPY